MDATTSKTPVKIAQKAIEKDEGERRPVGPQESGRTDGDSTKPSDDVRDPGRLPLDQQVQTAAEGEGAGDEGERAEERQQRDEGQAGPDQRDDAEGDGGDAAQSEEDGYCERVRCT